MLLVQLKRTLLQDAWVLQGHTFQDIIIIGVVLVGVCVYDERTDQVLKVTVEVWGVLPPMTFQPSPISGAHYTKVD